MRLTTQNLIFEGIIVKNINHTISLILPFVHFQKNRDKYNL